MSKKVTLTIDGRIVETTSDKTILQAALDHGIYIPHLCSHENLHPAGACRLCVVGQQGVDGVVTSCVTKARDGMVIDTHDETAEKIRKLSCDLMFKTHPSECTGCLKYGKCQLQSISQYVGDTGRKLRPRSIPVKANTQNPIIAHEMYRCILCGRCVRACGELRGVGAIRFADVDGRRQVVIDGNSLKDADCRFCGACVEVCPTGSIREQEAIMQKIEGRTREEGLVPCRYGCPAHIDVPKYIRFIREKNYPAAAAVVREKVPFPRILGHICVHKCETECRRQYLNEPISIRNLKRFAAEHDDGSWKERAFRRPSTGKKVAVIGAGPAGLTAAYFAAKLGHSVTVFDALEKPGGMMRYGIPSYRMPRAIVDEEIACILQEGVQLQCGTKIKNAPALLAQGFDAVLVAVGAHRGAKLPIPGSDLDGVLVNTDFLRGAETGQIRSIGKRAAVLGGGNVALDCAGVAKRLGAETVELACLESYDEMTASEEERAWALEEGLRLHNRKSFLEITGDAGHVTGVRIKGVKNFFFDSEGKSHIELEEDSEELIPCDSVIFAVGQRPDLGEDFGLPLSRGNRVAADENGATGVPGVFAAGDAVTGTTSVINAIAFARSAVSQMDRYLGGNGDIDERLAPEQNLDGYLGVIEKFGDLPRTKSRVKSPELRIKNFDAMDCGFDESMALAEANRCLQCDLRCDLVPQKFWSDYIVDREEVR